MSRSVALSCNEMVELVTEYLQGALSANDRERFEWHLRRCEPCRIYLEQMRQTIKALGWLPGESISKEAKQALLQAFTDWQKDRRT